MAVLQFPAVFAAPPRPKGSPTNSLTSSRRGIRPQASPSPSPLSSDRRLSSCSSSALSPLAPLCARKPRVLCRIGSVRCEALGEGPQQTFYQGIYGPWTVEPSDVREVILYRCGLVTAAASFIIAASTAFLPDGNVLGDIIKQDVDFFYATGAAGLGLSLFLIHIYVTPIKRFLQSLWAIGAFGSVVTYISLARPLDESLIQYVIDNPVALWFVGPLFAALTGLVFKEGLCYGKLEAGVLTFIIPGLLLGHLDLTSKEIFSTGREKDGLYMLDHPLSPTPATTTTTASPTCLTTSRANILWHARLGHGNLQHVTSAFSESSFSLFFQYDVCELCKHTQFVCSFCQ